MNANLIIVSDQLRQRGLGDARVHALDVLHESRQPRDAADLPQQSRGYLVSLLARVASAVILGGAGITTIM